VLWYEENRIGVAIMDQEQRSPLGSCAASLRASVT